MRGFLYRNSLSLTLFAIFALSLLGQLLAGWQAYNEEREALGASALALGQYVTSGHFVSALFENWESEFLQMSAYVVLTIFLRQQGSPESKPLDAETQEDEDPSEREGALPTGIRNRGAVLLWLYANSLSLALATLFLISFVLHLLGSTANGNAEAVLLGRPVQSALERLISADFWFESFQNWQSEFFAMGTFILLGVHLRQRGSPESKPVSAPREQTGH
jgi:Domain of unknown function (DUF6766)